jgi:serine/threonine protein kinase
MLKICDFDVTDFHSDLSVSSVDPASLVKTDAYSAPESQLGGQICQAYDSWSLGCMLQQFVTWYAEGFEGIDRLYDALKSRVNLPASKNAVYEGRFFQVDVVTKEASLKVAVEEVSTTC